MCELRDRTRKMLTHTTPSLPALTGPREKGESRAKLVAAETSSCMLLWPLPLLLDTVLAEDSFQNLLWICNIFNTLTFINEWLVFSAISHLNW